MIANKQSPLSLPYYKRTSRGGINAEDLLLKLCQRLLNSSRRDDIAGEYEAAGSNEGVGVDLQQGGSGSLPSSDQSPQADNLMAAYPSMVPLYTGEDKLFVCKSFRRIGYLFWMSSMLF